MKNLAAFYVITHTSERTQQNWKTFLSNHREVLAGMDFFTVPTINFKILYGFFILGHNRREILTFGVTENPNREWVIQQLRNAFPGVYLTEYLVFDNDPIFSGDFKDIVKEFELKPKQTNYRSPWQNGKVERWIKSLRNDVLDHIIPLNREHLLRIMGEYIKYYHKDRLHDALEKDAPISRPVQKCFDNAKIIAIPRLGGLHHRYEWTRAA